MTITLYTFLYNEENILPYFLKHYSQFVNKIVVYNNMSTDSSLEILNNWKDCEIEIRDFSTDNQYDEKTLMQLKNNCWKDNTDSDYIIVCDADELLYHPNILEFIKDRSYIDYYTPSGYHMIGDEIPRDYSKQIYDIIKNGTYDNNYDKNVLFKRKNVLETNYAPGAHLSSFQGTKRLINCTTDEIKLLHYKWLSPEYVIDKHINYKERTSEHSKSKAWGIHYTLSKEKMIEDYNNLKNKSITIV
jgi:glycosyltransferase involved in cell wall biosynthesis